MQDDQLLLIKLGFFEVWLHHVSRTVAGDDLSFAFDDGYCFTKAHLEIMYDVCGAPDQYGSRYRYN